MGVGVMAGVLQRRTGIMYLSFCIYDKKRLKRLDCQTVKTGGLIYHEKMSMIYFCLLYYPHPKKLHIFGPCRG